MTRRSAILDVIENTPARCVGALWSAGRVLAVVIGEPSAAAVEKRLRSGYPSLEITRGANPAGRQLREYFAGGRRRFTVKFDLSPLPPFARRLLAACARIPFGAVLTYGLAAKAIGRPRAARAAGRALARNPLPIIIPCHRVVAARGLGGFSATGGAALKRALLEFEAARTIM